MIEPVEATAVFVTPRDRKNAKGRARYQQCVELGECCDCRAKLQEDDAQRCVECYEKNAALKARKLTSRAGRKKEAKRVRARRAEKRAAGICVDCALPPVAGKSRCQEHLDDSTASTRAYRARKAAGITVLRTERTKRARVIEMPYVPIDELHATPRARLLMALRFRDWIRITDLLVAMEVSHDDRNIMDVTLSRLVRERLVAGDGPKGLRVYRLTAAGVAAADEYRAGRMPMRKSAEVRRAA